MTESLVDHIDPNEPVDLTNCDREPIHLLGRVQSYGALVALSADWTVRHASENLGEILGLDVADIIGRPVSDLIDAETLQRIREGAARSNISEIALRLFGVALRDNGKLFDLSLHDNGTYFILEFEPKAGPRSSDVMSEVFPLIRSIDTTHDLGTLARNAADGLRTIAGFDSVMVYEFQPDNSGRVIAESRADGETRYHGLNFPASDIPVQARALYKKALLRLIADVNDPGSVIRPGLDDDRKPVDLSLAVTRAVSPIHIEYLHNMGIEASMSVSIMKDGELWGLFACHHNSPRYIDYERRTAVELFAHLFSFELGQYQSMLRGRAQEDTTRLQTRIMAHMADGLALDQSLFSLSEDIDKVIPHDGIVLYHAGNFSANGTTPNAEEFEDIARLLDGGPGTGTFATEELGAVLPGASAFADRTAGILAIPVSRHPRDYLVLCREPVARKVNWAGDPTKPAEVGPNGTRLTPRKSFETWQQDVEGRSEAWSDHARHAADQLRVVLLEVFLKVTDATAEERRRAQEQQELLISELNHRVRNILNLMQGLVSQTKSDARGITDFTNRLDGRIQSLARAHDQLTRDRWEPAPLKELIRCEFEAYAAAKTDRVIIDGPDALLSPTAYTNVALVVHEMATNSMKYGALCDKSGRVEITIREDDAGGIGIDWKESGGPPVQAPARRGFGSTIIEMSIPHELGGAASIDYRVSGVEAQFAIPARHISRIELNDLPPATATIESVAPEGFHLSGSGLIVEDTLIIAMDAQGILEDFGAKDVSISASVSEALDLIETHRFDFALLDVNLGDEQSVPVAERLARDGVPFVVSTGYGEAPELLKSYPPCPVVQKPFSDETLRAAFAQAIANVAAEGD
ncbi:HWE histidine kinase domain-containing protein [Maritimibacter sp. UBA3975]|uniref:HWE histidine kinase domain-containing protein n=1 Tax=Maritimibacter sp. UBA3975 TaxID=1946833 RepID=UPI000C0932E7|nr:HWE histidine kinase domain-containing protein [Maritimibacter sp. UBA3975]MAM63070.1 histidine kinase [Maritimibacter sp.]|tara:strand:- start:1059 stop:3650 length:2592 start_codon:yes stop_codon:yes gene_type:complete